MEAAALVRAIVQSGQPAVVQRLPVVGWAAINEWTPEKLLRRLDRNALPLVDESSSPAFWWYDEFRQMGNAPLRLSAARRHGRENVSLEDFLRGRPALPPSSPPRYRQMNAKLVGHLATLAADAHPRRFLHVSAEPLADESLGKLLSDGAIEAACPENERESACHARLWAGEAGTASHAHYDGVANWFVQVHGRKRVLLWPPQDWEAMRLHPHPHPAHRQSQIDMEEEKKATAGSASSSSDDASDDAGNQDDADSKNDEDATPRAPPAPNATIVLSPGDALFIPPFWFHRIESLDFTTALSVTSQVEIGTRFDRACRVGLPSTVLDRAASPAQRAEAAHRFLSLVVLRAHRGRTADAVASMNSLRRGRHAPLAVPMRCASGWKGECSHGGRMAAAAAVASREESALAAAVAQVIVRDPARRSSAHTVVDEGEGLGQPLRGAEAIILHDYVEHVAGFAVGMQALCGFISKCFR